MTSTRKCHEAATKTTTSTNSYNGKEERKDWLENRLLFLAVQMIQMTYPTAAILTSFNWAEVKGDTIFKRDKALDRLMLQLRIDSSQVHS